MHSVSAKVFFICHDAPATGPTSPRYPGNGDYVGPAPLQAEISPWCWRRASNVAAAHEIGLEQTIPYPGSKSSAPPTSDGWSRPRCRLAKARPTAHNAAGIAVGRRHPSHGKSLGRNFRTACVRAALSPPYPRCAQTTRCTRDMDEAREPRLAVEEGQHTDVAAIHVQRDARNAARAQRSKFWFLAEAARWLNASASSAISCAPPY